MDHSSDGGGVFVLNGLVQPPKAQRSHGAALGALSLKDSAAAAEEDGLMAGVGEYTGLNDIGAAAGIAADAAIGSVEGHWLGSTISGNCYYQSGVAEALAN